MTSILVFGGDGQLGQELGALATTRGVPVIRVPRSEADIANADAVARAISTHHPGVVVNAAGYTKVDDAEAHAEEAFRENATGAAVVAQACTVMGLPHVYVSTDYVFDGTKPSAYREDDAISPINVYGRSKAAGEAAVRAAGGLHLVLRTSWLYGAFGKNFLKTILRLAGERDELTVVADQRGCPTASADLAGAILVAAVRLAAGDAVGGTYHLAGTGVTTWSEFASEIVAAQASFTHRRPLVHAIPTASYPSPARRPANSELDSTRFATTFGFRAKDWRVRTREVVAALLG